MNRNALKKTYFEKACLKKIYVNKFFDANNLKQMQKMSLKISMRGTCRKQCWF